MATSSLYKNFSINEDQARKIVESPSQTIRPTNSHYYTPKEIQMLIEKEKARAKGIKHI